MYIVPVCSYKVCVFFSLSAVLTVSLYSKTTRCRSALSANWSLIDLFLSRGLGQHVWKTKQKKKVLKKPKEMLGGGREGSRTSQEHGWTTVHKQSFAAGLRIFKCAPGLWSKYRPGVWGGARWKTSADFGWKWTLGCEQVRLFPCPRGGNDAFTASVTIRLTKIGTRLSGWPRSFLRHKKLPQQPVINLIKTGTLTVNSANLKICIPIKRGPKPNIIIMCSGHNWAEESRSPGIMTAQCCLTSRTGCFYELGRVTSAE